ncbi:helix-turn-helix domain-containing protein [Microbacterium hydrocarbonoxydans]|uniref:helix-turn-helix domain-containing protein n=1 Tax=Microbacterium hydrocarbonoxydans TaxID=273678 RepID=UPI00203F7AFC|nr:helix-turn-helix transcriptional regulator [Microbacterium hydrocarbonoxydans]MCM3779877.1 helix-turn-helix domain-containing protein [Microbacterium hydrocarbonoxydans]
MTSDEQIGKNLVELRGDRSQKDLADEMRKRGFRWSQATVWSIEKGERPLRLSEADAVADILGETVNMLVATGEKFTVTMLFRAVRDPLDEIESLTDEAFREQKTMALLAGHLVDDEMRRLAFRDSPLRAAWTAMVTAMEKHDAWRRTSDQVDGPDALEPSPEYDALIEFWRSEIASYTPSRENDGVDQAEG